MSLGDFWRHTQEAALAVFMVLMFALPTAALLYLVLPPAIPFLLVLAVAFASIVGFFFLLFRRRIRCSTESCAALQSIAEQVHSDFSAENTSLLQVGAWWSHGGWR